jgi:Ca-activated chloride channel family protein
MMQGFVNGAVILGAMLSASDSGADCSLDAMLVFDSSGSMATLAADAPFVSRIDEARDAIKQAMPDVAGFRRVGLVVYGPGAAAPCENVTLRLMPKPDAAADIQAEIDRLIPQGDTPLTQAVDTAAQAMIADTGAGEIVLITDGRETCGQPCALGAKYAQEGKIVVHVIGFKISENFQRWPGFAAESGALEREPSRCLADLTGGLFVLTDTVEQLTEALRETLGCAVVGGLRPRTKAARQTLKHIA